MLPEIGHSIPSNDKDRHDQFYWSTDHGDHGLAPSVDLTKRARWELCHALDRSETARKLFVASARIDGIDRPEQILFGRSITKASRQLFSLQFGTKRLVHVEYGAFSCVRLYPLAQRLQP